MQSAAPKILVVEDEPTIAETLAYALNTEGYEPICCSTAGAALEVFDTQPIALVVLDIGLPDGNGFEVCHRLRQSSDVPVLFLTARGAEVDRVAGLEQGADDYMVKPFSPRELTARVRAILRRTAPPSAKTPSEPAPTALDIDRARMRVRYHGIPVDLARYEFRLLDVLASRPGRVFSRDALMEAAWEDPGASTDRTVDTHIKTLRAKLRAVSPDGADPIRTVRGVGYALRDAP